MNMNIVKITYAPVGTLGIPLLGPESVAIAAHVFSNGVPEGTSETIKPQQVDGFWDLRDEGFKRDPAAEPKDGGRLWSAFRVPLRKGDVKEVPFAIDSEPGFAFRLFDPVGNTERAPESQRFSLWLWGEEGGDAATASLARYLNVRAVPAKWRFMCQMGQREELRPPQSDRAHVSSQPTSEWVHVSSHPIYEETITIWTMINALGDGWAFSSDDEYPSLAETPIGAALNLKMRDPHLAPFEFSAKITWNANPPEKIAGMDFEEWDRWRDGEVVLRSDGRRGMPRFVIELGSSLWPNVNLLTAAGQEASRQVFEETLESLTTAFDLAQVEERKTV